MQLGFLFFWRLSVMLFCRNCFVLNGFCCLFNRSSCRWVDSVVCFCRCCFVLWMDYVVSFAGIVVCGMDSVVYSIGTHVVFELFPLLFFEWIVVFWMDAVICSIGILVFWMDSVSCFFRNCCVLNGFCCLCKWKSCFF